jgi:hypothetical protein
LTTPALGALFCVLLAGCAGDDVPIDSSSDPSPDDTSPTVPSSTGSSCYDCWSETYQSGADPSQDSDLADYCAGLEPDDGGTGDSTDTGTSETGADETGEGTTAGVFPRSFPGLDQDQCEYFCAGAAPEYGEQLNDCQIVAVTDDCSWFTIDCEYTRCMDNCGIGGRMHEIVESRSVAGNSLGGWLGAVAHNEAASVHSFEALARELREHGAPAELIERVFAARDDEVRHARMMTALARAETVTPPVPEVASALSSRGLLAIAIENAAEGCVHETWAALEAHYQARHAHDPRLRATMRTIAEDETRHAQLAWDIDAWCRQRLSEAEYARVERARESAARDRLQRAQVDHGFEREAGLPAPDVAQRLGRGLYRHLWAAGAAA